MATLSRHSRRRGSYNGPQQSNEQGTSVTEGRGARAAKSRLTSSSEIIAEHILVRKRVRHPGHVMLLDAAINAHTPAKLPPRLSRFKVYIDRSSILKREKLISTLQVSPLSYH